jgi:hypothetical protein
LIGNSFKLTSFEEFESFFTIFKRLWENISIIFLDQTPLQLRVGICEMLDSDAGTWVVGEDIQGIFSKPIITVTRANATIIYIKTNIESGFEEDKSHQGYKVRPNVEKRRG